jgi:hypothetical protein
VLADEKKHGDAETEVPDIDNVPRKPRDILCLLLFLVAWIGWLIVAMMAVTDGCPDNCNDPNKLIYGFDSKACMCGKDCTKDGGPDNTGKLRLYIPDPRDPALRLCMASCPADFGFDKKKSVSSGAYVCPTAGGEEWCKTTGLDAKQKQNGEAMFYQERTHGSLLTMEGASDNCFLPSANITDCWYPTYPTNDVFFKCIPTIPTNFSDEQKEQLQAAGLPIGGGDFGNAMGSLGNPAGEVGVWAAELNQTAYLLGVAFGVALIMGFVFLLLIRLFAVPIVWLCMVGLLIMCLASTLLLWDRAGVIPVFSTIGVCMCVCVCARASITLYISSNRRKRADSQVGSNTTALAAGSRVKG